MNRINMRDKITSAMSKQELEGQALATKYLIQKIRDVWEYLPSDIPDYSYFNTNVIGDPWLIYPYDKALISSIIEIFESSGWESNWSTRESEVGSGFGNQNPKIRFTHSDTSMIVMCEFNDSLVGSTCRRKVVGRKQVEQDIVEFVCSDGADEHD